MRWLGRALVILWLVVSIATIGPLALLLIAREVQRWALNDRTANEETI